MELNLDTYKFIMEASRRHEEVRFSVDKSITPLAGMAAPQDWHPYSGPSMSVQDTTTVFNKAGSDRRGALTKIILSVYRGGGRVEFKAKGSDEIWVRAVWPQDA